MDHRDRVLKTLADDVARALADDRGGLQLLRCLGLLSDGADEAVTPAAPRPGWVGIWEPHAENGSTSYRRSPERSAEWASWVDLAKNDLDGLSLGALVSSSLALEPDAIVIYAGNNWAQAPALVKGWPERHLAATVLREQGVPGLKSYLDGKHLELFETRLRGPLAALSARVPIALVVPEFNLGDWSFAGPADAPWLPGDGNERWVRCYLEAERALREDRLAEAEARAREMIELDGGTAASGFTLLASCRRRGGADGELRGLLQKARDARSWDATAQPPRPLTFLQDALRRAGSRDGIRLVDLPKVFEEHLGGLPDRRLFLDYCHLTSDGIRLAMSAVAETLAPVLGGRETARAELFGVPLAVDPEVESEARFAAAIHNAHWGQSGDVVHHHCVEALRACPGIASAMQGLVELQCRRAPAWMCGAGERLDRKATVDHVDVQVAAQGSRGPGQVPRRRPPGRRDRGPRGGGCAGPGAARNMEAGLDYQLLPVFGEIHTLTATVAAE